MLTLPAIDSLKRELASALASMDLTDAVFGSPQAVEKAAAESEKLFQGIAKALPPKEEAYAAALALYRGSRLNDRQVDLVASALSVRLREAAGACCLGSKKFASLLERYDADARDDRLWRLTWYGLLSSYFAFDASQALAGEREGWERLRAMLQRTWLLVDERAQRGRVPQWIEVMRTETQLLSRRPADKYARDFMGGKPEAVERLAADLGIPASSWFWHALVLSAVQHATSSDDEEFRRLIPKLIDLIEQRPVFRDEAIELILVRYHASHSAPVHEQLRDYVVRKDVWRNPKLKAAGIATAWNRVPDVVWRMVLAWVNEGNLRDFFDILAARNQADEGRLAFWSRYLKQITWTRLVFGSDTLELARKQQNIRDLIAREEGAYAMLTANRGVDAFMMQIGDHVFVEFSKKPNASYGYLFKKLKFNRYQRHYTGGTDDLKYGFYDKAALRIAHYEGWQKEAGDELRRLGICPDAAIEAAAGRQGLRITREPASTQSRAPAIAGSLMKDQAPLGAPFSMEELQRLVARHLSARVRDSRGASGGRLWVEDDMDSRSLAGRLKELGFRWANSRSSWYYPES